MQTWNRAKQATTPELQVAWKLQAHYLSAALIISAVLLSDVEAHNLISRRCLLFHLNIKDKYSH